MKYDFVCLEIPICPWICRKYLWDFLIVIFPSSSVKKGKSFPGTILLFLPIYGHLISTMESSSFLIFPSGELPRKQNDGLTNNPVGRTSSPVAFSNASLATFSYEFPWRIDGTFSGGGLYMLLQREYKFLSGVALIISPNLDAVILVFLSSIHNLHLDCCRVFFSKSFASDSVTVLMFST